MPIIKIPCCIIRGGTSKGIFIEGKYLPKNMNERDNILLRLFGSPDIRQIDGLGGADPLTSKVAIVNKSDRSDADIEFLAAEVGIKDPVVNYAIMCGNTLSAAGHFAIQTGLVRGVSPYTEIRIYCHNNNKIIISKVPVKNGMLLSDGDYQISGVPGTSAATKMNFLQPGGAITGKLLPTGNAVDTININSTNLDFSLVDSGTLYAFVNANNLELNGNESPEVLDMKEGFLDKINTIRGEISAYINQLCVIQKKIQPNHIKIAIIASPSTCNSTPCSNKNSVDIIARIINPYKTHKAYAVSGAVCLASASVIQGTLVNHIIGRKASPAEINIEHPSGIIDVSIAYNLHNERIDILGAEIQRTARILMCGDAYINA